MDFRELFSHHRQIWNSFPQISILFRMQHKFDNLILMALDTVPDNLPQETLLNLIWLFSSLMFQWM